MAVRCVLVHTCFQPELERRPEMCGCSRWVTAAEAERMQKDGEAKPSFLHQADGSLVLDTKTKNPIRESKHIAAPKAVKTPRTPTIEKAHIERAYLPALFAADTRNMSPEEAEEYEAQRVRGIRERERIEAYGALNEKMWEELGAGFRLRGTHSPAVPMKLIREPRGEAVITDWGDGRTGVGAGVNVIGRRCPQCDAVNYDGEQCDCQKAAA